MVLQILRALFVLLMAAAGWFFIQQPGRPFGDYTWLAMAITMSIAVLFVCVDILSPRKKLAVFSGTFLGLIVGMMVAYALSFVVKLVVDLDLPQHVPPEQRASLNLCINIVVGLVCCYLCISFILQTKDDFRFIIPYVEFSRQVRGGRSILIDTSIIIDGRILDVVETGILDTRLIVPRFVLQELQTLADLGDRLKRNRGRRGLDVLNKLQTNKRAEVILYDWTGHSSPGSTADDSVDQKLLILAKELNARLLTNDFNLAKVAQVRGVEVINLNDMASALRPVVLPGERLTVKLLKPGEEPSQGVGFLDDGTMVVVEQGRGFLNTDVEISVSNVLQTATGRMIFGRVAETPARPVNRPPPPADSGKRTTEKSTDGGKVKAEG
jgi:uncharacterized protein YacL